ncbi:MAG: CFI-box-CTERM domain-containing protein [Myxococcota bacterium]
MKTLALRPPRDLLGNEQAQVAASRTGPSPEGASAQPEDPSHGLDLRTFGVSSRSGAGNLPIPLQQGIQRLSGVDVSDVQVHYGSGEPARRRTRAHAFGNEIHLGPGQERHLAHEAWHVVQQRQGRVRPTLQRQGVPINNEPGLEREADVMGAKAQGSMNAVPMLQPQPVSTAAPQPVMQCAGLDDPEWDQVDGVARSGVGASGVYFMNHPDARLVVKPTSQAVEIERNHDILHRMGLNAPRVRSVATDSAEGQAIHKKILEHLPEDKQKEYVANMADATHFSIMDSVDATSFRQLRGRDLLHHLGNDDVMQSIGKHAVADAFLGIGDRLLVNQNPGNLMVRDDGSVHAIDNESHPDHQVDRPIGTLRSLLDGHRTDGIARNFGLRAGQASGIPVAAGTLTTKKKSLKNVDKGIKQGFKDLVEVARGLPEDHPMHGRAQQVLRLHESRKGFKCYLTTACMRHAGLPDDCRPLTVLRAFRDGYMASLPHGPRLIARYYETAPRIVAHIEHSEDRDSIYAWLHGVIDGCVASIDHGRPQAALNDYCRMVLLLERQFGTEATEARP